MSTKSERKRSTKAAREAFKQEFEHYVNTAPQLASTQQFEELARLGSAYGVNYMQPQADEGVSNDKLGFAPEFHIFQNGKLAGVICAPGSGKELDTVRKVVFEKYKDAVVMQIASAWISRKGKRASKQLDRITISHAAVFTSPNTQVAGWLKPVGTPEDFKRAGWLARLMTKVMKDNKGNKKKVAA